MKRTRYLFLILALAIFLLGACQPATKEVSIPVTGRGILNLYGIDPLTLDPARSTEMTSHQYIVQLFSGLVRLDDNLKPAPDIAERWEVGDDGRTYTFYLRRDVLFHDSRGVKAEDFKYSWERASNPATGSLTAANYLGDIVGVKEVLAGKSKEISGIRIIDDYTLKVTIDAPKSYFLAKLTYPVAFVVDRANVASGSKWWQKPNGTGAFKLREWQKDNLLMLARNELYYGEKAKIDTAVFKLWGGVPMNMYEAGEIDIAAVPIEYIDRATDSASPFSRELVIAPELSFQYIGFNTTKPPFNNINIRRAFSLAVDKDKLVSLVFRDTVERAEGILPPGMPGFNRDLVGMNYDGNKAKQLIRESEYGDVLRLPSITLTTAGWGGLVSTELEALIQQWRENLGVEVKVRQIEPERFFYHLKEEKDEMFAIGWIADYPHPQGLLDVLFHSGAENNYGEYSNAEIDALLEKANLEKDDALSLALYQKAEQKLIEDAACLPLWFGRNYVLVKPHVQGYKVNPLGFAMLNKVSIKTE